MDIQLGSERIFALEDRFGADEARQRAMDRRSHAFGTGIGSILQRPKADDIDLVGGQRRLEPFWHVACRARYVYERTRDYAVAASSAEVKEVTFLGTTYPVAESGPSARTFTISALEHCRDEFVHESHADGGTGARVPDAAAVIGGPKHEVTDPTTLAAEDTVVVAPQHRASFIVRQMLAEMMKPIQADRMIEESLVLEHTDLYYRPVWAFEFHWRPKDKRGVVEIDAITGETRQGASLLAQASKLVTRDALFDIGADTVGLLVPGGSIAVKVARAAIDKGY
jgi:hypothetical protein